ncbi:dihydrofolate reductase [Aquisalimonas lutea]|uniref:dihydrofolate reductase n=1 Tax=Aquisalimonas lutea TaxID=1327750 RepID=UPI0025B2B767|nr:dihydrofolate reductase [Aquisalimonas lutea]MDN3516083.1 dihydrofolate reductase [Aquisalimonas lutea]
MIALIAALTPDRVIGRDNGLPWHIPDDLRHFKRLTRGKPVIMGRRNYLSIGRPLPERTNIVLSRSQDFEAPGCRVVDTPEAAVEAAGDAGEIMVIGGAEIYRLFLPRAQRMYLTWVETDLTGDTHFPAYDTAAWRVADEQRQPPGEGTPYALCYQTLERCPEPC